MTDLLIKNRSTSVLNTFPDAKFAGKVGIAISSVSTKDLRLAWKGIECHQGHGLSPALFSMPKRPRVMFLGYDETTHILLYSFGAQGAPLSSSKGKLLKFGNEVRIDRRPSTHGVPQRDTPTPQREIDSWQIEPGIFAIEIPEDFLKKTKVEPIVERAAARSRAATTLETWITTNRGRCIKRADLAHVTKLDDTKSAFQRATTAIKAYARANPTVLHQIDLGERKHVYIVAFPRAQDC